jgi:hypothetical protein
MQTQTFINGSNNITWTARIVNVGDKYGLNFALTNDKKPMIEFYDTRYQHTEFGQFVGRYNLSTFFGIEQGSGLLLDTMSKNWYLDASTVEAIKNWVALETMENV